MSLINEALKKAQRQRAAEASVPGPTPELSSPPPTVVQGQPGFQTTKHHKPAVGQSLVLLALCLTILLIGAGTTALILRSPTETPAVTAAALPAPAATAAETPESVLPEPVVESPVPVETTAPMPPPAATVVATAAPVTEPAPTPAPANPVTTTIVERVTPPAPPPVLASPRTPQKDQRIYIFLDKLQVTGIKASQTDPRVLMNGRMYRINDIVDNQLMLRLTGITSLALTFTDSNGLVYTRSF